MATFHGKEGTVLVGSNAVAEVKNFTVTQTVETADDTVMGDTWRSHKAGFKSWNGSLTCNFDDTDATGQEALTAGASVTLNLQPEGNTTGDYLLTGTATITEVTQTSDSEGIVERSFNFLGNGSLTISTVS